MVPPSFGLAGVSCRATVAVPQQSVPGTEDARTNIGVCLLMRILSGKERQGRLPGTYKVVFITGPPTGEDLHCHDGFGCRYCLPAVAAPLFCSSQLSVW